MQQHLDCEGWLVPVVTNAHQGDCLDVFYYYGGKLNSANDISVYAVTPEGDRQYLKMTGRKETHCIFQIDIRENGLYHLIGAQNGYYCEDAQGNRSRGTFEDNPDAVSATHFLHYAHTTVQAGSSSKSLKCFGDFAPPLCIVPDNWSSFYVGDIFSFKLFFMGRPLPLYDVDIFFFPANGEVRREKCITNGDGSVLFPLSTAGKYLISVTYLSPDCVDRLYYDTEYTYTFWFKARV